ALVFIRFCRKHDEEAAADWWYSPPAEYPTEKFEWMKRCTCGDKCLSSWIWCDRCNGCYHPLCVGMTESLAETTDVWYCKRCVTEDQAPQVKRKPRIKASKRKLRTRANRIGMAADSAKREDLDAAEPRQRPVKSKAVAGDADNEPGPSKRGRMELTRRELAEPKAMNAEATTSTRQTAAAEEVPLLAAQSSATATLEPPMPLAVVTEHLHDENRQPQNMAEEPSLREAMAQHHCQELTSRDKRIAEQEQQLSSKTDELRNKTTEIEGLKKRIAELESARMNGLDAAAQQ
ncbi:hypothetical protein AAVH_33439, partial [Aphelenchoides avenae]